MEKITLNYLNTLKFIDSTELTSFQKRINLYHNVLHSKTNTYKNFLGWIDSINDDEREEIERIQSVAEEIKATSDVFIVVGVGGSYLGARAAIEMLNHSFYNELRREKRNGPKIYFAGHHMSTTYIKDLLEIIGEQDVSINVISKSGTTTEPALVFRILKEYMYNRYGEEANRRIYVTTDGHKGALKILADKEGYETFTVPEDVGGRYSVLTPVGLLPMAVAGIDINHVILGSEAAKDDLSNSKLEDNPAYQYAAIRNILYTKGKIIEIIANYEPKLFFFGEWFKQLFGESEGKDEKGIFPTTLNYTTDLHSIGQYIQDGKRNLFETVLNIEKSKEKIAIKEDECNLDGLNYLKEKTLDYINQKAMEGAVNAHVSGDVPNVMINIPEISPYYFGYLSYFFMKACAMSGLLLGINPFNQLGVDEYKNNMFQLLGKPRVDKEYRVEIIDNYDIKLGS